MYVIDCVHTHHIDSFPCVPLFFQLHFFLLLFFIFSILSIPLFLNDVKLSEK